MSNDKPTPVVSVKLFDYVRFVIRGDADYVQHQIDIVTRTFDGYRSAHTLSSGGCKCWPTPATASKPAGRVWECWGPGSQFVYLLPFAPWARWLSRLDVRVWVQEIDALGLDVMYAAFRAAGAAKTVTRYISAPRQKRGGQQTGGDTLAVGSHKADIRMSWYKKADNPLAFETQASGELLQKAAWATVKQHDDNPHAAECWWSLAERIEQQAEARIKSLSGYTHFDLLCQALDARADALLLGVVAEREERPDEAPDV